MWVDWNPTPADKNMGLWGPVYLTESGPIALRNPHVVPALDLATLDTATLTVSTEVWNATGAAGHWHRATARSSDITFAQPVTLGPRERKTITFTPDQRQGTEHLEAAPVVALPPRRAASLHARADGGRAGARVRSAAGPLRDSADDVRADRQRPPRLQGERQTDPRARRRLGVGHAAAARVDGAAARGAALHARDGAQHDPARRQARNRRVLRPRRRVRDSRDARVVLLRSVGDCGTSGTPRTIASGPPRFAIRFFVCAITRACWSG